MSKGHMSMCSYKWMHDQLSTKVGQHGPCPRSRGSPLYCTTCVLCPRQRRIYTMMNCATGDVERGIGDYK